MELKDRVALVTGASGGLGGVIAQTLATAGIHIAVAYQSHRDNAQVLVIDGGIHFH